jgi:hypothetical protein
MARGKYECSGCKNDIFFFLAKPVRGAHGRITAEVLACAKCGKHYHISPCNTNGLKLVEDKS